MTRPIRVPDGVFVPQLETVLGGVFWVAGSVALAGGPGTVAMAAGLGATGWLWRVARRAHGPGTPLGPDRRSRLIRLAALVAVLVVGALVGLGMTDWSELAVPVACGIVGIGAFSVSSVLAERSFVAIGGLLLLLAAAGALLALTSAGATGPQGLVGYGGAAVVWLAGAVRLGLLGELRARVRR